MALPLLTFGHGTASGDQMADLLLGANLSCVVDIRTAPGSRRNPAAQQDFLASFLPSIGIQYRWERRLGGFRRVAPDSPDVVWRNDAFRGYAGYTRTSDFLAAMDELLAASSTIRTTVMCAESVWWRCHRRIVADFATLARGVPVLHLMHDGTLRPHALSEGVRLRDDGLLVYDGGQEQLPGLSE